MNIQSKINKLIMAINLKGQTYLFNKEQYFNKKVSKVCTMYKLFRFLTVEEYNKMFPNDKKDPTKIDNIRLMIKMSPKKEDILFKLVEIYKQAGEGNG